ncbi:MAG: DHH family phosphoesterase, partial [Desulfobacteraceae bacterium]|nr:DHH family phosphoesterase [Desulfobacteraceae bacterium]
MSTLVFGHKNPDSDTVCAAIALADLKKKLGEDIVAVIPG